MANLQGTHSVDLVMCIDGTGSMGPFIDDVKQNAKGFYAKLEEAMLSASKIPAGVRVKVVVFGDYASDDEPMRESRFFNLPEETAEYEAFVDGIEPCGGGDIPENGLEAIAVAMQSDWAPKTTGMKRRQVIAVFTDAPALEYGIRNGEPNYPTDIPATMEDLTAAWEGTSSGQEGSGKYHPKAGRLVLFVPNDESWTQLESLSRATTAYSGTAGGGLSDMDMEMILNVIVSSF